MTRTPTLDDLAAIAEPSSPVLTPDGTRVVYALTRRDASGAPRSELRSLSIDDRAETSLTSGAIDTAPAVAPDGETVAFVREHEGTPSIHRIPLAGGDAVPLTRGLRVVGGPSFSPDGAHLAFTALVDDLEATPPAPLVVTGDPGHRVDGMGWIGTARTHVFVVPVAGGPSERLTTEGQCGSPAWSPDGATIAFAQSGVEVDGTRFARRVGLVDLTRPRESVRFPFTATGVGGPLTWTTDGASVIAIGDLEVGVGLNRLVRLDAADGAATVIAGDLDRNVMGGGPGYPGGSPAFGSDGRLYCCVREGGQTVVLSLDLATGDVRQHPAGDDAVVGGLSIAGARAVVRVSDASAPGELALLDLEQGSHERLTDHLGTSLPGVAFLTPSAVRFAISDGTEVHGWLLRAPGVDGPAPTLLDIHGGPHNAWTGTADTVHLYHQLLAAQGWNVLTLNPRGSDGYGEAFYTAAVGGWGEVDEPDFLEPLDRLVADGVADPDRLAVTGYSYGGFMTCWLTSRTDRFRAAVPGGLVCDHRTVNASSDMGGVLHDLEVGGAENAVRLSPSTYVDAVTTPSLILHGQDDQRCPLGQAELWYARLRERGVETELVVYPGGSHLFILNGPLAHRRDYNQRVVDWVVAHTG
ncbi:dipeptidyl aminopeptidase/acylaminoacyl peptidase [Microcella alkaliphila]|uniref:Dipeptidyl aminopeptidase/acylaminoacyl peptidase n=1 Tax=Microcella alkaliphila TaxID=279828 RepID=A0A4Q7U0Q6_9MICO|nr:S9 family peptidase [Microcella alkaliphila]RZT66457.1 dipeptidyl aminopeptidase/acylaminoacyl peptidase [Microcella alkaliphila]